MIRYPWKEAVRVDSAAGHQVISYLAALLAAATNATSNALNRKAAREAPGLAQFRLRLVTDLLHRKAWLAAIGLQALQADGTGPDGVPAERREQRGRPVKAGGQ